MLMHRRKLLALTGLSFLPASAAFAGFPPNLVGSFSDPLRKAGSSASHRCLIHIMLEGGNDSLNTVIPKKDPDYRRLRPTIALGEHEPLSIADGLGLHPALMPMMDIWQDGEMRIFCGVEKTSLASHFLATQAWYCDQSTPANKVGWLSQACGAKVTTPSPWGLVLGSTDGPLGGGRLNNVYLEVANDGRFCDPRARKNTLGINKNVKIERMYQSIPVGIFPSTQLGRELQAAAAAIMTGDHPAAIHITHGDYDTHGDQRLVHDGLLEDLAQSLAAFRILLQQTGHWEDVAVITGSEFGRSVAENTIAGTDHGGPTCHFMMGGKVAGGITGKQLSCQEILAKRYSLTNQDVRHAVMRV